MNIRQSSTRLAFVLTIIALIAGFSACDQIQQLLHPRDASQMEGSQWRDFRGPRFAYHRKARLVWLTDTTWF